MNEPDTSGQIDLLGQCKLGDECSGSGVSIAPVALASAPWRGVVVEWSLVEPRSSVGQRVSGIGIGGVGEL